LIFRLARGEQLRFLAALYGSREKPAVAYAVAAEYDQLADRSAAAAEAAADRLGDL
jgi:hypothetical protein